MKYPVVLFALSVTAFGQTISTNPDVAWVDNITQASARIVYQLSSGSANAGRVRVIPLPGNSCQSGAGTVRNDLWGPMHTTDGNNMGFLVQLVRGLQGNTQYLLCPDVSADGGKTWVQSHPGFTITTDPMPNPAPQAPQPVKRFSTDAPSLINPTATAALPNNDDCTALTNQLNSFIHSQRGTGVELITLAANSVCTGNVRPNVLSPDAVVLFAADSPFNTTTGEIYSPKHGLTEGQALVFDYSNAEVAGRAYAPGGFPSAKSFQQRLFVNVPVFAYPTDADHFQVYLNAKKGSACNPGHSLNGDCPTLWQMSDQGRGVILYAPWPRPLKTIVVRTSTPDAQFVPEHVEVNPAWAPKMARIQSPNRNLGFDASLRPIMINFDGGPGSEASDNYFNANIRFEGVELTYEPYPLASFSQDPPQGQQLLRVNNDNSGFILDRCFIHGWPSPFRTYRVLDWDGAEVGLVDNWFEHMEMPRQHNAGLALNGSGTTFTIDPGSTRFGDINANLSAKVTVKLSGKPLQTSRLFTFFDWQGALNIAVPPGMTGTCSGAPCRIYTSQTGSARNGDQSISNGFFWIDPIFTATGKKTPASLFVQVPAPPVNINLAVAAKGGMRFVPTSAGLLTGLRFYRIPGSPSPTATVSILSDDGRNMYATALTKLSSFGWQTVTFPKPFSVTPGVTYQANLQGDIAWSPNMTDNQSFANNGLQSVATFRNATGSCDPGNGWSTIPDGLGGFSTAVGLVGCVDLNAAGTIASVITPQSGSTGFGSNSLGLATRGGVPEGCQCMVGGVGPGPYAAINNHIEAVGNPWHHDGGGNLNPRSNYYYSRNLFRVPEYARLGFPGSNRFRYHHRQNLEWKGGSYIEIVGNIFENAFNDITGSSLFFSPGNQNVGVRDIAVRSNVFRDGPGITNMMTQYTLAPVPVRGEFSNNLAYNIGPYAVPGQETGRAWGFEYPQGESFKVDGNTFANWVGSFNTLIWMAPGQSPESFAVTNNVIPISNNLPFASPLIGGDGLGQAGGEKLLTSSYAPWLHSTIQGNALFPQAFSMTDTVSAGRDGIRTFTSTLTVKDLLAAFPGLSATNQMMASGFQRAPVLAAKSTDAPMSFDPLLTPAMGGKGVNVTTLSQAQGFVTVAQVPSSKITTTSAKIEWRAPDTQACPVDYAVLNKADPNLVQTFSRVADPGQDRSRSLTLTGLKSKTVYFYRINCARQQPTGAFVTK